jgi:hypothetical protein
MQRTKNIAILRTNLYSKLFDYFANHGKLFEERFRSDFKKIPKLFSSFCFAATEDDSFE